MKSLTCAAVLDDHLLFADSFALLLQKYGTFEAVSSFSKVDDFLGFLQSFGDQKLYVFLDYYLSEGNGLSIFTDIKRWNKQAKTIFVTSAISPAVIKNIVKYKPHGIISKFADIKEVVKCIKLVESGISHIDPRFAALLTQPDKPGINLTPREIELLKYFSQGNSIAETAAKTFLSPHTVVAHRRKMMAKVKCRTIAELLTYARDNEVI
ncbi:response regulator transcription factor [Sphingobacterium sp. FBM7-1]|uniref:response regulator transcription factor n=1 Tax=Sphingobacterium sp. FBM7-1 TaxID=2886688 RepID=UPI001D106869|nr:response regulator transcription factor [Sphingobacterium sp. FBM7-1]MCC2598830.1 response regulator transcription factor [Sphingobacterium sp. FBM7-1]